MVGGNANIPSYDRTSKTKLPRNCDFQNRSAAKLTVDNDSQEAVKQRL